MRKTDARTLDAKALTELRVRAVTCVHEGENLNTVARVFGFTRQAMYNWLMRYRMDGVNGLNAKKRGGRKPTLDGKALAWLYNTVTMKNPRQLKFESTLWTCQMIATLIDRRFGVRLSRWSVMRLLKQLGLTPQRPMWRAYQQNPKAVEKWIHEDYPKIKALAKRMHAAIYFGNEAGVRLDHHAGATRGARGTRPVISTTGARSGMNLVSATSPRRYLRFMAVKGRVDAEVLISFLRRLLYGQTGPVFLIVDWHPVHRAKKVSHFLGSVKGKLRLFFLPPYASKQNPIHTCGTTPGSMSDVMAYMGRTR